MTIYTLILWLLLAAAALTASLGYGHSKLRKDNTMHLTAWFVQYFIGSLMIFSGLVKAVDPMGTGYKMKDYFVEFKAQGLPLMDFMVDMSLPFAIFMIVFELVIGICLIFGVGGKKTLFGNLAMMIFFTVLTGFNYLTGFTPKGATADLNVGIFQFSQWAAFDNNNIRISDCGCFGDFLKLKPIETFLKDILFTGLSIYIYGVAYKMKEILPATPKVRNSFVAVVTLLVTWFCFANFYFNEPMVDFRPFYEGVNTVTAKAECKKNAPKKEITFTYNNKATGKNEDFLATALPTNIGDTTAWKYVGRRDKEISEGCKSKITEFTQFPELDDYSQYDELAKSDGYALVIVTSHPQKGNKDAFARIAKIAKEASEAKGIPAYGLYYHVEDENKDGQTDDDLEKFRHDMQLPVDFRFGDEKLVLTISRANPGLLLMHKGTILKKWHHRHIPADFAALKEFMK
jgi:uncharacterized membrane protein YphA (DoxX/SURF4 family)